MRRELFLDILVHSYLTSFLALWIYLKSGSLFYSAVFIFGGIFIDLDHLIDYFIAYGSKFSIKDFFGSGSLKSGKVYLFLHSWEIIFIILLFYLVTSSYAVLLLFLSMSMHLIIDNLQRENLRIYFLTYRIINKFDVRLILPEAILLFPELKDK
ncbi:MAG: hypothetical protein ABIH18_08550 [Candidatus Omnitrophota bacterium]